MLFIIKPYHRVTRFIPCVFVLTVIFFALPGMAVSTVLAQPVPRIEGVALPDSARIVLAEIMREAGVASARVTSTYRAPEDQVRIMHGYVQRHGIARTKQLYGPEGDAVIDAYERNRNKANGEVLAAMLDELHRQLPIAFANKRLMHLHPCYYTFDVSMRSIPAARHDAFIQAAERHPDVHRFLGPGQGEREAFHIEIARPGECPEEYR